MTDTYLNISLHWQMNVEAKIENNLQEYVLFVV